MTAIGALFRQLRGRQTYRAFAATLGPPFVDHAYVYKIEKGLKTPSPALVEQVVRNLGLSERERSILLLCLRNRVDPQVAILGWNGRANPLLSDAHVAVASVLTHAFGILPVDALDKASKLLGSCASTDDAIAAAMSHVPPHFEGG